VPHGKGRVALGDTIYCTCVQHEELLLITRLRVASLADDPDDRESVLVEDADEYWGGEAESEIPAEVAQAIEFEPQPGSTRRLPIIQVRIDGSQLKGHASLRALAEGSNELDELL
jgi:hypothetical protein